MIEVIQSSSSVSYQDLGRFGYRKLGVPPAGVMDRSSAQLANQLLGNLPNDLLIEIGPGGLEVELHGASWLALAGCATSQQLPSGTAREFFPGEKIKIGGSSEGLWSYLAAPGGWTAFSSFGSCSYHSRSEMGLKIDTGDQLRFQSALDFPSVHSRYSADQALDFLSPPTLRLHRGPHFDEFLTAERERLVNHQWQVSPSSDRSGYQLTGHSLQGSGTISSLPVLVGSLQVPPSGEPIVTLNDGPTVGGYPIIAVIEFEDLPYFVQRPPFSNINFTWYDETPS